MISAWIRRVNNNHVSERGAAGEATVQNYDRTDMTSSADWTRGVLYSLYDGVWCVTGPDTIIASGDYLGVRKEGNPPCNAEDKSARRTPRH